MRLGMATGFGDSADTNTTATTALQVALLQVQTSAVLPVPAQGLSSSESQSVALNDRTYATLSMPEDWVRGAMLVRCNSLLREHSAVRPKVTKLLLALLKFHFGEVYRPRELYARYPVPWARWK